MSNKFFIDDLADDYFPFAFAGYGTTGHCFLRIWTHGSNALVLCTQLPNYHSTSVTNGLESIIDALVAKLMSDRKLSAIEEGRSLFSNLFRGSKQERERAHFDNARRQFLRRCRWFEHYPPGVGFAPEGSLSLVILAGYASGHLYTVPDYRSDPKSNWRKFR